MKQRMAYGDVTMAEVAAYFPGLTAVASASAANPVDPETAEWLDGPSFVRWIRNHGLRTDDQLGDSISRSLYRWEEGAAVGIDRADAILIELGHVLSDLPDHMWRRPPRKARPRQKTEEARLHAVERVNDGETPTDVARDIGVSAHALRSWVRQEAA